MAALDLVKATSQPTTFALCRSAVVCMCVHKKNKKQYKSWLFCVRVLLRTASSSSSSSSSLSTPSPSQMSEKSVVKDSLPAGHAFHYETIMKDPKKMPLVVMGNLSYEILHTGGFIKLYTLKGRLYWSTQATFSMKKPDWKFHFAIARQDVPRAWDIIAKLFTESKCEFGMKVRWQSLLPSDHGEPSQSPQHGQGVTEGGEGEGEKVAEEEAKGTEGQQQQEEQEEETPSLRGPGRCGAVRLLCTFSLTTKSTKIWGLSWRMVRHWHSPKRTKRT